MTLDPHMAGVAQRTAAVWRAQQPDEITLRTWTEVAYVAGDEAQASTRHVLGCDCVACCVVRAETHLAIEATDLLRASSSRDYEAIILWMRSVGREDVVHFAGAAHRDIAAARVVEQWMRDPDGDVEILRRRALGLPGVTL